MNTRMRNTSRYIRLTFFAVGIHTLLFISVTLPNMSGSDLAWYQSIARALLDTHTFGGATYLAPGWPVWLAALMALGGDSTASIIGGQIILHAILSVGVYALVRHIASERRALVAGIATAAWPLLFLAGLQYGDPFLLTSVLLLSALLCILYAVSHRSLSAAGAGGIMLGLTALTEPIFLYVPIVFIIWGIFTFRNTHIPAKKLSLLSLIFLTCFSAPISVWALRNAYVFNTIAVDENGNPLNRAPFIVKEIERDIFSRTSIAQITNTASDSSARQIASHVVVPFAPPYGLTLLDQYATVSHRDLMHKIIFEQYPLTSLPAQDVAIMGAKIFLTILHVASILMVFILAPRVTRYSFGFLCVLLIGYTGGSALIANIIDTTTPPASFIIPLIPLCIATISAGAMKIRAPLKN